MDSLKLKRPTRGTDGMKVSSVSGNERKQMVAEKVLKEVPPRVPDNRSSKSHFIKKESGARKFVRRLSIVALVFVCSVSSTGFLYSRARIELTLESQQYTIEKVLEVSTVPKIGAVHGIWVTGSSGDLGYRSVYPEYIPVASTVDEGVSLVLSQADIKKSIGNEVAKKFPSNKYTIGKIKILEADFDNYYFISRSESISTFVKLGVSMDSAITARMVSEQCSYKSVLSKDSSLQQCLEDIPGVRSARVVIHPWFAVRTPIARAIEVVIVE